MKWRSGLFAFWLVVGFPALMMATTADGSFDPTPAPLPLLRGNRSDTSILANAEWVFAVAVVYGPIAVLAAAALWRWVRQFVTRERRER
jgi:hypothetical protein